MGTEPCATTGYYGYEVDPSQESGKHGVMSIGFEYNKVLWAPV